MRERHCDCSTGCESAGTSGSAAGLSSDFALDSFCFSVPCFFVLLLPDPSGFCSLELQLSDFVLSVVSEVRRKEE
ncbi:hypothetical protein XENOCAPTIV_029066 [Xenoophorus captivus]|uniref:Uncharacterized protein n=1 Tax=Xenoophorus captivus TaxID=1517983 RepID=A0ABV0RVT9_9TELE